MPHTVTYQIRADKVRKGDDVLIADEKVCTVGSVDVKTKYTTITDDVDVWRKRYENDATVVVQREEPTEEEKRVEMRAAANKMISHLIAKSIEDFDTAKTKMVESLGLTSHVSSYETYVMAQHQYVLWSWVERALANGSHDDGTPFVDLVDAAQAVVEEETRKLLEHTRFASRSTSVIHNAVEDLENEATQRWLRHNRMWYRNV